MCGICHFLLLWQNTFQGSTRKGEFILVHSSRVGSHGNRTWGLPSQHLLSGGREQYMSLSCLAPSHSAPNSAMECCYLSVECASPPGWPNLEALLQTFPEVCFHSDKPSEYGSIFLTMKYYLTHNKCLPNPKFLNTVSNSVAKFILSYLLYLNL